MKNCILSFLVVTSPAYTSDFLDKSGCAIGVLAKDKVRFLANNDTS